MFKALIHPSKCEYTRNVISILLLLLYVQPSIQLSLTEGQDAVLTFPYPCDSTEVTLQHGFRTPFYHLTSPENQGERLRVENRISDGNCFLDLMIGSVIRSDQGTYISFVYEDGQILIVKKIFLDIEHGDYPPGTASCVEVEGGGRGDDWVSIECTAEVGSLSGKIECFQNGKLMPYLTNPVETHTTLTQTILARSTQPVFCCSSTLNESKGQCACHDTALYLPDNSTKDPCPITTTSTTTSMYMYTMSFIYNSTELTTDIPTKIYKGNNKSMIANYILVIIIVAFLSVVTILIVYIKRKVKTRSNQSQNSISLLEQNSSERELDRVNREGYLTI